eukprot:COSAG03_NODE_20190_length_323_cov_0.691964_1_plen_26_part_01
MGMVPIDPEHTSAGSDATSVHGTTHT